MMYTRNDLNKNNIDLYLNALAKEYKKISKMPAELIIVGGASIVINYGFRDTTYDIDAVFTAESIMKDAIQKIAEKYNLPNGWVNNDFTKTVSYSNKLVEISKFYKEFSNILQVRTIKSEYLIAMKLKSARQYKHDLSDIIGIINEHIRVKDPINIETIEKAYKYLYNESINMENESIKLIYEYINKGNYNENTFNSIVSSEQIAKNVLIDFERDYPNLLNEGNLNDILENKLKKAKERMKDNTMVNNRNDVER